MSNWDSSVIERIFAEKERERSDDRDNLLHLTSQRLYGEKIHYALELIQNAEDENSSSVVFIFNDDNVAIVNDGTPFDELDVWRICSVMPQKKKNKIGFFGIGFKSVFNITRTPQVISNGFNFEIVDYIYPKSRTCIPETLERYYSPDKGAIFVLPLSSDSATRQELIDSFNRLDDKILLFLENVQKLEFVDAVSGAEWRLEKSLEQNSTISIWDSRDEEESRWRVFHRTIPVDDEATLPEGKEGLSETRISIGLPVDAAVRESVRKTGVVYCYLPTKRRTDLSFLIQADFLPTIGRENVSDHPWNVWLMRELGQLVADAIDAVKDDPEFSDSLHDFVPLSEEIQDDLIRELYHTLFERLREKEVARTTVSWVEPQHCVIPNDDRLRSILGESDLRSLLQKDVFFIHADLSEPDHYTRAEEVLFELGATRIGATEVVDFLHRDKEHRSKSKQWFLDLYDYLRATFDPVDMDEDDEALFGRLESANFILTHEDGLVPLKDPELPGRLICYYQRIDVSRVPQLITERDVIFLHPFFQESTIVGRKEDNAETEEKRKPVKEWLDAVGVKKHFKESHIIRHVILPKFITGRHTEFSDEQLYELIDYVRSYWPTIESDIRNKRFSASVIDELKSGLMLKSYKYQGGNKIHQYRSPNEIYFSKGYGKGMRMEDLFEGIDNVHFLSPYYLNRERAERRKKTRPGQRPKGAYTWMKFFEALGVWRSPRVVKEDTWTAISGHERYDWVQKEYSSRGTHELYGNSYSEDLERLIAHCSESDQQEDVRKRMALLWDSLDRHWTIYRQEHCQCRYRWYYYTLQHRDCQTSSFLELLRNAAWVPGDDGGFYRPSEVFPDTRKNRLLLGDDADYVALNGGDTFLGDLMLRTEPSTEEVISHLRAYRATNPHPSQNELERMSVLYGFLWENVNRISDPEHEDHASEELREAFDEHELLYLPREDKAWWTPRQVFWIDFSDRFGALRGYMEHNGSPVYDVSLKDHFLSVGVADKPLLEACFDVLEDLCVLGDLDYHRRLAPKIYTYMNELAERDSAETISWDKPVFLSETGQLLRPSELYYDDSEEYKTYFGAKVETLYLPYAWGNIRTMLQVGGFQGLRQNSSVVKRLGGLDEIEGDATSQLIERLSSIEHYLRRHKVELLRELSEEGVFQRIKALRAYETPTIVLDFSLPAEDGPPISVTGVAKDAYFSSDEYRLYVSSSTPLLSTAVARELSSLFGDGAPEVPALLDSLLAAQGEEELDEKLRLLGIDSVGSFVEEPSEDVRLIASAERPEQESEPRNGKDEPKLRETTRQLPRPRISVPAPVRSDLIDPREFVFDTIEERTPYTSTDGMPSAPTASVTLRKASPVALEGDRRARARVGRLDAEGIALELAMRFEETEGRTPHDRHEQRGIGYDIYSEGGNEEKRFIEVKHFRGDARTWQLTAHQWKKAEQEQDSYFVYVVSGLREGREPIIEVLQNPSNYLTPNPPRTKRFSNWQNGIMQVIKCRKA